MHTTVSVNGQHNKGVPLTDSTPQELIDDGVQIRLHTLLSPAAARYP